MDRYLRSVAIVIEVTSRHMECTHFNLDYSQMPAVSPQRALQAKPANSSFCNVYVGWLFMFSAAFKGVNFDLPLEYNN